MSIGPTHQPDHGGPPENLATNTSPAGTGDATGPDSPLAAVPADRVRSLIAEGLAAGKPPLAVLVEAFRLDRALRSVISSAGSAPPHPGIDQAAHALRPPPSTPAAPSLCCLRLAFGDQAEQVSREVAFRQRQRRLAEQQAAIGRAWRPVRAPKVGRLGEQLSLINRPRRGPRGFTRDAARVARAVVRRALDAYSEALAAELPAAVEGVVRQEFARRGRDGAR